MSQLQDVFAAGMFEYFYGAVADFSARLEFHHGQVSGERHVPMPGVDFGEFQEGLAEAFDQGELTSLLKVQMNVRLGQIVAPGSFNDVTFNLLDWVERRNRAAPRHKNPAITVSSVEGSGI